MQHMGEEHADHGQVFLLTVLSPSTVLLVLTAG
jgi:hypothetical protein